MSSLSTREAIFEFPWSRWRALGRNSRERKQRTALTAELQASIAREEMLREEMRCLSQRHVVLTQEFEHRVFNGLQLIASLLSLQSRAAKSREAAAELNIAAVRIAAFGRVHRTLHLLDRQKTVELKEYLEHLCEDLSGMLLPGRSCNAIEVNCAKVEIPTAFAVPLALIVSELTTNSAKYSEGSITVRFETKSPSSHSLSVLDHGPGLPKGFDPSSSKGLGMKIVLSLAKQIGGELHISPEDNRRGAHFKITFDSVRSGPDGTRLIRR
jgi:two-component system, sensor histidine kinase PdtaS